VPRGVTVWCDSYDRPEVNSTDRADDTSIVIEFYDCNDNVRI